MSRFMVIKNGREISSHNLKSNAQKSQKLHGGYIEQVFSKTEALEMDRPVRKRR
jgi:hypothetical protein